MIRMAVCDDDRLFAAKFEVMVRREALKIGLSVETEVYTDGFALMNDMRKGCRYELIFLNIEMEQMNGISVARAIMEMDQSMLLIFLSGNERYLNGHLEVEPFQFLQKPVDDEMFRRYFQEACERINKADSFFQYKFKKNIHRVELRDIMYFVSRKRIISIIHDDETEEYFYGKLNDIEKELSESRYRFLRIHQSFLVNYNYIEEFSFTDITLVSNRGTETKLRISKNRANEIRFVLCGIASGKAFHRK